MNDAFTADENELPITLVALDISPIFDTISHDVLFHRLKTEFGVNGDTIDWLRSYLTGRSPFVKLGEHSSDVVRRYPGSQRSVPAGHTVVCGIRLSMSSLIESFRLKYHRSADNTQLYVALDPVYTNAEVSHLPSCSTALQQWFQHNNLQLSADKSEVVVFGTCHQLHLISDVSTVDVAGNQLPVKSHIKSLGIICNSHCASTIMPL